MAETDEGHPNQGQDDITVLAEALQEQPEFADMSLDECVVIAEKMIGEGWTTADDWPHRSPGKRYTQMEATSRRI